MMIKLADQREILFSKQKNTECVTSYKTVGSKSVSLGWKKWQWKDLNKIFQT